MRKLTFFILILLVGCQIPKNQNTYFDYTNRDDKLPGGVKTIQIETPSGKFNVWTKRVGNNPLYLSIDIDVLDPAHAPGTGTPEIAGMTTREIVNVIRGLSGLNLVSADIVEVAPAYDHAEVTSLAAATIVYELTNLFAKT